MRAKLPPHSDPIRHIEERARSAAEILRAVPFRRWCCRQGGPFHEADVVGLFVLGPSFPGEPFRSPSAVLSNWSRFISNEQRNFALCGNRQKLRMNGYLRQSKYFWRSPLAL